MTPRRVLAIRPEAAFLQVLTGLLEKRDCDVEMCSGNVEAVHREFDT